MTPLVIIADDITGAADSAARAHAAGLSAEIRLRGPVRGCAATALTSDSRHLPATQAAERVRATVEAAGAPPGTHWYKKIDSTLRGNIAAELGATLESIGRDVALVCPAFPAHGRGLVGGRLVAPGLREPGPDLLALLGSAQHIPLDAVRAGQPALAAHLAGLSGRRRGHAPLRIVADALTDGDLAALEAATAQAIPEALRCGSAGLAGALARRLANESPANAAPPPLLGGAGAGGSGPALVIVGSGSAASQRQVAYLRRQPGVRAIVYDPAGPDALAQHEGAVDEAYRLPTWLLHLPPPAPGAQLDGPAARELAGRLAERAAQLIARAGPRLVVLAGGDTAMALLARLGIDRLRVLRELLPGMPLAYGEDATGRARCFALKPGGFGDDSALAALLALG